MIIFYEVNGDKDEVTLVVFHDYSPNRHEMIEALMSTGDFTRELLDILDNYELEKLCNEYEV